MFLNLISLIDFIGSLDGDWHPSPEGPFMRRWRWWRWEHRSMTDAEAYEYWI